MIYSVGYIIYIFLHVIYIIYTLEWFQHVVLNKGGFCIWLHHLTSLTVPVHPNIHFLHCEAQQPGSAGMG